MRISSQRVSPNSTGQIQGITITPAMYKRKLGRSHQPLVTLISEPGKDPFGVYCWFETARLMKVGVMDLLNLPTSWYANQRFSILSYGY